MLAHWLISTLRCIFCRSSRLSSDFFTRKKNPSPSVSPSPRSPTRRARTLNLSWSSSQYGPHDDGRNNTESGAELWLTLHATLGQANNMGGSEERGGGGGVFQKSISIFGLTRTFLPDSIIAVRATSNVQATSVLRIPWHFHRKPVAFWSVFDKYIAHPVCSSVAWPTGRQGEGGGRKKNSMAMALRGFRTAPKDYLWVRKAAWPYWPTSTSCLCRVHTNRLTPIRNTHARIQLDNCGICRYGATCPWNQRAFIERQIVLHKP